MNKKIRPLVLAMLALALLAVSTTASAESLLRIKKVLYHFQRCIRHTQCLHHLPPVQPMIREVGFVTVH